MRNVIFAAVIMVVVFSSFVFLPQLCCDNVNEKAITNMSALGDVPKIPNSGNDPHNNVSIGGKEDRYYHKSLASLVKELTGHYIYHSPLELSVLILTAAILLIGLINLGPMWYAIKRLGELRSEIDKRFEDRAKIIEEQIKANVSENLADKIHNFSKDMRDKAIDLFEEYSEVDFSKPLEEKNLSVEYVHYRTWDRVRAAIMRAQTEPEKMRCWDLLFRVQVALRQLLSANPRDVFTGLGTLRSIASMGLVPTRALWDLICLMKRQGRLEDDNNRDLARRLGRDLGLTFKDCPQNSNPSSPIPSS